MGGSTATAGKVEDADIFPTKLITPSWTDSLFYGRVYSIRESWLDIFKTANTLSKEFEQKKPLGTNIYCDVLNFSGPIKDGELVLSDLPLQWNTLKFLHIYCRSFFPNVNGLKGISISKNGNLNFRLVVDVLPPNLNIICKNTDSTPNKNLNAAPNEKKRFKVWELSRGMSAGPTIVQGATSQNEYSSLMAGEAGWNIKIRGTDSFVVEKLSSVPAGELSYPSVEDLMIYRDVADRVKMLPKLLELQFMTVSAQVFQTNPPTAEIISRLRFIVLCAKDSVDLATLASDARLMLERLEAPFRYPDPTAAGANVKFYVPVINATRCAARLQERLAESEKLEEKSNNLSDMNDLTGMTHSNMSTLIGELAKFSNGFLNVSSTEEAAQKALIDLDQKVQDMQGYMKATKDAQKKFDDGLAKYKEDQQKKFVQECWKLVAEVTIGIVASLATGGAGAPAAAGAIAGDVKKAVDAGSKLKKLWEALKKLGEIAKDVGPKLYEAYNAQSNLQVLGIKTDASEKTDRAQSLRDSLAKMTQSVGADGLPSNQVASTDFLGILASWQEFDAQIDVSFASMKDALENSPVDGMDDYKLALKNQCIRGKTVLSAMRVSQEATQLFLRQSAEVQARKEREDELQELAKSIGSQGISEMRARNELRLAYHRRLTKVRRALFLTLHESALAYVYMSGSTDFPTKLLHPTTNAKLRSDIPAKEFGEFVGFVRGGIDSATEKEVGRQDTDVPPTVDTLTHVGTVFRKDWKALAAQSGLISFIIPPNLLPEAQKYYRVRVKSLQVDVYSTDKDASNDFKKVSGISWAARFGPFMLDRNQGKQVAKFYVDQRTLTGVTGAPKGWLNELLTYVGPTVYSELRVTISPDALIKKMGAPAPVTVNSAAPTPQAMAQATEAALAKVSKIEFTFVCEGINLE